MSKESILGFDLFTWNEWEEIDSNIFLFYNVAFIPASLQKHNGKDVELSRNGDIAIWDGKQKQEEVDLFSVPEFVGYISGKIKK